MSFCAGTQQINFGKHKLSKERKAFSRWHYNGRKGVTFVFMGRSMGKIGGEKSARMVEGGRVRAKRQEELPILSRLSPNLHAGPPWTGRDIDSQVAAQGDRLQYDLLRGTTCSQKSQSRRLNAAMAGAMTDALPLRFPWIFIKSFLALVGPFRLYEPMFYRKSFVD